MARGHLFLLIGPSGSGKTTLIRAACGRIPSLRFIPTTTTRPPRPGEQDGREYFFVSPEEFDGLIARSDLLEWQWVHQNRYGTSRSRFAQAIEEGINQPLYIKRLFKGYAVPDYGPIPPTPKNPYLDKVEKHNPFAYNPGKGKALLKAHGWKVVPGGTDTCVKPGKGAKDCGKGIKKGAKLSFTLLVATTPPIPDMSAAEKATWSTMGINVSLNKATFDTIIGKAVPCKAKTKSCSWEMANWGGGWVFAPDYYPSGEELFLPGAGANTGNYTTAKANNLIKQTDVKTVSLNKYEDWLTKQVPVIWEPVHGAGPFEIHKGLKGIGTVENAFSDFTAATWHW